MNTKVIGIIVLVVVILGGGYMLMSKKGESGTDNVTGTGQTVTSGNNGKYSMVGDAAATGKSIKCEYSQTAGGYSSKVTYFISGDNIRAEITSVNTTSFMILTKDSVSTWNDLTAKPRVTTLSLSAGPSAEVMTNSLKRTPLTGFDCRETNIEASLFVAPK